MQGDLEPAKSAEQRISPAWANRWLTWRWQSRSYLCRLSSHPTLHSAGALAKAPISRCLLQPPWMLETLQLSQLTSGLGTGTGSGTEPEPPLGPSPGFTKGERKLGSTCDFKRSRRAKHLPSMPTPKPLSWGAEVGGSQGSALAVAPPPPPRGSQPLFPPNVRLEGECVPRRSLRYKHSEHACCCLPTPEDFLVLSGDWKRAEMF